MIRGLSGTAIVEDEAGIGGEDDGGGQGEVKDLEHGVKQGGKVFVRPIVPDSPRHGVCMTAVPMLILKNMRA